MSSHRLKSIGAGPTNYLPRTIVGTLVSIADVLVIANLVSFV
jgi:hypothetical protein